jgi:hypothetical protein
MNHINDGLNILICFRLFFGEAFASQRFHYDTAGLQFLLDFLRRNSFFGGGSTQHSTGAVACRAERFPHGPLFTQKKVRGRAHAAWDEHRLSGKGAGSPFSVHENPSLLPIHHVTLHLCDGSYVAILQYYGIEGK